MMSWSEYPLWSLIVVAVLAILLMYLVRSQAHSLIWRLARLVYSQLRLLSRVCLRSAQRVRLRNHELTKALAEALMERQLERRFMRIEKMVERDLANYQQLSAEINQQLVAIDEDYRESAVVPDGSPEWVEAVDAIASLQANERNSDVINKILDNIHVTVQRHHRDSLREHRWTVSSRHKVLSGLQSHWRKLSKLLQNIDNNIVVLRHRLRQVDQHMGQFEMITAGSGQGIMSSMLMRFISSLCFVLVGFGAALINWQLLQQPLAELLPLQPINGISLPPVMAGLHIAISLMAATMITEALRITHLFPLVTAMTSRGRQVMVICGQLLLLALIAIEVLALLAAPITVATSEIAGVSQLLLVLVGIAMPLMLSLVMIPLEYLMHTARPIVGSALQICLHVMAVVLRVIGSLSLQLGRFTIHVYDLVIVVPLRLEQHWLQRIGAANPASSVGQEPLDTANVTNLKYGSASSPEQRH